MSTVIWIFYNEGLGIKFCVLFNFVRIYFYDHFAKFKVHEIKYQLGLNKLIFACMKLLKSLNVSLFAFHS